MLKSFMDYGCAATKVRAMYGKRLTESEWEHLDEASSMTEIAVILRDSRGWQHASSLIPSGTTDVDTFTIAVRRQVRRERESLIKFVSGADKEYISLLIREDEYRLILAALRRLKSAHFGTRREVSELLRRKSRVNFHALLSSRTYSDLLAATESSIYYEALASLPLDKAGYPDYATAAALLENIYYESLYKTVMKKYSGLSRQKLRELVGAEADVFNILSILRILRHFPDSVKDTGRLVIPVHRRLSKELLSALSAAPSEAIAVNILRDSYWRDIFADYDPKNLDRMFDASLEALNKKLLRDADPSLASVVAYINLKKLEGERLVRAITSIHYGIPPKGIVG